MAGAGFKNFTTGEVLTASDVQGYLMDQSVMVFAGTAARASAIPSPSEGMVTYRTDDDAVEVYDGSAWNSIGGVGAAVISSPAATGSYSSGGTTYNYYTFTASGTLTVDTAGLLDVVICAGGGAGGYHTSSANYGGGGGGGGVIRTQMYLASGSYTVTVGAGGAKQGFAGKSGKIGFPSGIGSFAAVGGGGGGGEGSSADPGPATGGSGGGGSGGLAGGTGFSGQGNNGGASVSLDGGGGGGATAAGTAGNAGGTGGAGYTETLTNTSLVLGAGGTKGTQTDGTTNRGIGGGGGGATAGNGGSGIVIVRVAV